MRDDKMLVLRIPPADRERLERQARAAGMTQHAFGRTTLLARLRRLEEAEWGRPAPRAARAAAELRARLAKVEEHGTKRLTISQRCADLADFYRDVLEALEADADR